MRRVSVGYMDGGLHPLWTAKLGLRAARLLGAQSLWLPDMIMGPIPRRLWTVEQTPAAKIAPSPDAGLDPIQILAAVAARIRNVDVGTAVTDAIRNHPASLARSFVTLDHLTKGRAILGIGNGTKLNTEPYGLPWNKQVSRLEEALSVIRLLWESGGRPVDFDGRFWTLRDAVFDQPLYGGKAPRIWVASHAPRMLSLTGRFADGWLPTEKVSGDEYGRRLSEIESAARAAGRPFDTFVPAQLVYPTVLGRSREQILESLVSNRVAAGFALNIPAVVWQQHGLDHPMGNDSKGWYDLVTSRVTERHVERSLATLTPELLDTMLFAGSPEEVCEQLAPLVEAGARHLIVTSFGPVFADETIADFRRLRKLIKLLKRL